MKLKMKLNHEAITVLTHIQEECKEIISESNEKCEEPVSKEVKAYWTGASAIADLIRNKCLVIIRDNAGKDLMGSVSTGEEVKLAFQDALEICHDVALEIDYEYVDGTYTFEQCAAMQWACRQIEKRIGEKANNAKR